MEESLLYNQMFFWKLVKLVLVPVILIVGFCFVFLVKTVDCNLN